MFDHVISQLQKITLAVFCGSFINIQTAQATDTTPEQTSVAPTPPTIGLTALSAPSFLQLLISRNVEIRYSKLNTEVTRFLKLGEEALYESTFFMGIREENRYRQRATEERLQNAITAGTAILDENAHSDEIGVRKKLSSGADLSVSYKSSRKSNNLIPQTSDYDTEYNAVLNLTLKQPLLRNAGKPVTETDRRVAELEHQIALQQLTLQTLKSSIDGLSVFWQLHRAQETVKLRKEAIASTTGLMADLKARVAAGKTPASATLELQGVMLNRQAELARSQQAWREAQGKLATTINIRWSESNPIGIETLPRTSTPSLTTSTPALEDALRRWAPYQIAQLKQQQAQVRLDFSHNQTRPLLDFVMSFNGTGYDNKLHEARNAAEQGSYPDWFFGINFEFPLNGNQKAQQQFLAQSSRLTQSELEVMSIQNSFANDLTMRLSDLENARAVLEFSEQEVKIRQSIFDNERQRVDLGAGLLGTLIQRQIEWIEARQRLLENQTRFELALATWQYTQGSLLADHQIEISAESVTTP